MVQGRSDGLPGQAYQKRALVPAEIRLGVGVTLRFVTEKCQGGITDDPAFVAGRIPAVGIVQ